MFKLRALFSVIMLLPFLVACDAYKGDDRTLLERAWTKPWPYGMGKAPEGSPTFQQGWEDGCATGLGAYGSGHYRKRSNRFRQDISMVDDPEYYRAWKDAYTYCRFYVFNWSRSFYTK